MNTSNIVTFSVNCIY